MLATFIIKANITRIATNEMSLEDTVLDTLTEHFTRESANVGGTECWLDDVVIEQE